MTHRNDLLSHEHFELYVTEEIFVFGELLMQWPKNQFYFVYVLSDIAYKQPWAFRQPPIHTMKG